MNDKIDNALKGNQSNSLKVPEVAQSKPNSGVADDFERRLAVEKRIRQLEEQIAKKNSEMEKEKIKHEKMQLQITNIDEFQMK